MTSVPPHALIGSTASAFMQSRCLHAAVQFGVADHLGDAPQHASELARKVGVMPDPLSRILRVLAATGIFVDHGDDQYGHSEASRILRADHPQSMSSIVRMWGARYHWAAYELLPDTVRTGVTAFDSVFGCSIFDYFAGHPDDARDFDHAMTAKARPDNAAVARVCDLRDARCIVDLGGGAGHLIRTLLLRAPAAEGILFDRPNVIAGVKDRKFDRLTCRAGDFFSDDLPAADVYLLMQVLHDWSDNDCVRILQNVRRAMAPGARLLVIEMILDKAAGSTASSGIGAKMLDVEMLALFGGRERSCGEYEDLFRRAGLELARLTPTATAMKVLEAVPGRSG